MAIHGAGRVPAIEGLGLEAGKVETDRRGIRVNEHLQSISNPAVYVAGDANSTGCATDAGSRYGCPYRHR